MEECPALDGMDAVRLACVDDDARGEPLTVAWSAELDATRTEADPWQTLAQGGTDDPAIFAAYLRTWVNCTRREGILDIHAGTVTERDRGAGFARAFDDEAARLAAFLPPAGPGGES